MLQRAVDSIAIGTDEPLFRASTPRPGCLSSGAAEHVPIKTIASVWKPSFERPSGRWPAASDQLPEDIEPLVEDVYPERSPG